MDINLLRCNFIHWHSWYGWFPRWLTPTWVFWTGKQAKCRLYPVSYSVYIVKICKLWNKQIWCNAVQISKSVVGANNGILCLKMAEAEFWSLFIFGIMATWRLANISHVTFLRFWSKWIAKMQGNKMHIVCMPWFRSKVAYFEETCRKTCTFRLFNVER